MLLSCLNYKFQTIAMEQQSPSSHLEVVRSFEEFKPFFKVNLDLLLSQLISQTEDLTDSDLDYIFLTCALKSVLNSRYHLAKANFEQSFRQLAKAEDVINRLAEERGDEFKVFLAVIVYPEYVKTVQGYCEGKMDFMGKVPAIPEEWFEVEDDVHEVIPQEVIPPPDQRETKEDEGSPVIEDEKQEQADPAEDGAIVEGVGYAIASLESLEDFLTSIRPLEKQGTFREHFAELRVDLHFDASSLYILQDHHQIALEHLEKALVLLDKSEEYSLVSSIHVQRATSFNNLNQLDKAQDALTHSLTQLRLHLSCELSKLDRPLPSDDNLAMPSIFDTPLTSSLKQQIKLILERIEDCRFQLTFDFEKLRQEQAAKTVTFTSDAARELADEGFGQPMKESAKFTEVKAKFKIGQKRTYGEQQKSDQACGGEIVKEDVEKDDIKRKKLQ
ncbi:hypothetical protein FGO68_gene4154 [Halteria grandinella]|uniref:Uncharacterized protein n=1 Tax=Halteria grandinella TaxID=5974 RepID=A0A8J8NDK8_HALGN|nr:hypothetical protein FGO68_gene4154 [Halteria grandinella]